MYNLYCFCYARNVRLPHSGPPDISAGAGWDLTNEQTNEHTNQPTNQNTNMTDRNTS